METTTIQVSKETVQLLKKIKERRRFSSFDEAIKEMAKKGLLKKSLFGSLGRVGDMREILEDLRDEENRKL